MCALRRREFGLNFNRSPPDLASGYFSAFSAREAGGTPYNGLYGEAPPERGNFFTLQVYERVGILRV